MAERCPYKVIFVMGGMQVGWSNSSDQAYIRRRALELLNRLGGNLGYKEIHIYYLGEG